MTELPGLSTSSDPLDLAAYRRDLWPRTTLATLQGQTLTQPAKVVWPRSQQQVQQALELAEAEDRAVVPYGAGSGVCGGAAGRQDALVVDLKAMDRVLELDPVARTVRVQPGIIGQHLEDWLAQRGWMTAHSPSSIWCSTVGGYVAARSAGQFSSRYGVFDDMLLAARAQAPAGRIDAGTWTPRGQEDLLPVIAGSEGGLAIVTEALLRIAPLPETRWLRGYAFPNLQSAWTAMRLLLQAGLWPSVIRLYDPLDTRINRTTRGGRPHREGPSLLGRLRTAAAAVPGLQRHLADLPLALPQLVNTVVGTLGQDVALIVGFEGPSPVVEAQLRIAQDILAAGRDLGSGPGERWFAHRHSVSYKQAPFFAAGAFADTMEVAAPWSRLEALHDQVRGAIGRHGVVMAHFSHAYPEGCSIYFSFAARGQLDVYDALWSDALAAVRQAGGTVTHHHGVGQLKSAAAAAEVGAGLRTWQELRQRWDPDGRMNPGRPFAEELPASFEDHAPPEGPGPIYSLDEQDMLARVDPHAEPAVLEQALEQRGLQLRIRPDRPLVEWLTSLQRDALDAWEAPCFGVQARFEDGVAARLGPAPRSAAGPDLRMALLRRAQAEWVELPLRRLQADQPDLVLRPPADAGLDARDVRPTWRKDDRWGFDPVLQPVAEAVGGSPARGRSPRRRPTQSRLQAAPLETTAAPTDQEQP